MKSFLTYLLAACAALLLLNACDSDDNTSLSGTWTAREFMMTFDGGGFNEVDLPDSWNETLTLAKDGNYTYAWDKDGRSGSGNGTWSTENNTLSLTEKGRNETTNYSLDGNNLTLRSSVPGGNAELIYRK